MSIEARNTFIISQREKGLSFHRIGIHRRVNLCTAQVRNICKALMTVAQYKRAKSLVQRAA